MIPGVAETRDTIAAIATPSGRGGIGVVRVSGANVASLAARVLGKLPSARRATLSRFRAADGEILDQGIAIYFPPPNSYTGEPVLELHGHGGPVVLQAVLSACLEAGARLAQPGEFTKRAFLSGKLDLAQAESVADLIDAASREAARSALRSLSGEFSAAVNSLVQGLVELRLRMEAMLDFPEEEVGGLHGDEAAARLAGIRNDLDLLLARSRRGSLLASGIYVVIAGRPNVGKSSLLNRLLGTERAIVTPIAGTTRDAVREPTNIEGVPLVLVDTAGLRLAPDEIERIGIERTREELGQADVVLAVFEAGTQAESLEDDMPTGAVRIDVYNKLDLAPDFHPTASTNACVLVSAMTGAGLDELRQAILAAAGWSNTGESVFLARERHLNALEEARSGLARAAEKQLPWEFFAEELRLAQSALDEITGEISADDMLGEIFSRFCIGK